MKDKKEQLLSNVKFAVQKYGMDGITVRNLSDACGVNDSHLHRFFKNKEELLLQAYERESNAIFTTMLHNLDETIDIPLDFRSRIRLHFHRTWEDMLSDPARLAFCVYYYHSSCFESAKDFHNEQVELLYDRVKDYFIDKQSYIMTVYSLFYFLYDNAKRLIDSNIQSTPETEEFLFNQYYGLLVNQVINVGA